MRVEIQEKEFTEKHLKRQKLMGSGRKKNEGRHEAG
jgi:hypothetical protein